MQLELALADGVDALGELVLEILERGVLLPQGGAFVVDRGRFGSPS